MVELGVGPGIGRVSGGPAAGYDRGASGLAGPESSWVFELEFEDQWELGCRPEMIAEGFAGAADQVVVVATEAVAEAALEAAGPAGSPSDSGGKQQRADSAAYSACSEHSSASAGLG